MELQRKAPSLGALSKAIAVFPENNQERPISQLPRAVTLIQKSVRPAKILTDLGDGTAVGGFVKAPHIPGDLEGCAHVCVQERRERVLLSTCLWLTVHKQAGKARTGLQIAWALNVCLTTTSVGKPYWLRVVKQNLQPAVG